MVGQGWLSGSSRALEPLSSPRLPSFPFPPAKPSSQPLNSYLRFNRNHHLQSFHRGGHEARDSVDPVSDDRPSRADASSSPALKDPPAGRLQAAHPAHVSWDSDTAPKIASKTKDGSTSSQKSSLGSWWKAGFSPPLSFWMYVSHLPSFRVLEILLTSPPDEPPGVLSSR